MSDHKPLLPSRNPVKARAGRKAARVSPWRSFRLPGSDKTGERKPPVVG